VSFAESHYLVDAPSAPNATPEDAPTQENIVKSQDTEKTKTQLVEAKMVTSKTKEDLLTLNTTRDYMKHDNKDHYIYVTAPWCGPCIKLKK